MPTSSRHGSGPGGKGGSPPQPHAVPRLPGQNHVNIQNMTRYGGNSNVPRGIPGPNTLSHGPGTVHNGGNHNVQAGAQRSPSGNRMIPASHLQNALGGGHGGPHGQGIRMRNRSVSQDDDIVLHHPEGFDQDDLMLQ